MLDDLKSEDLLLGFLYAKPMSRSFPLCKPSDFRPHSSSDPFGATFPPGEGIYMRVAPIIFVSRETKSRPSLELWKISCYNDRVYKEV